MKTPRKTFKEEKTEELANAIVFFNRLPIVEHNSRGNSEQFRFMVDEFLRRKDYVDYLEMILEDFLEVSIRNREVLHFYIRAFLGLYVPRKKFCTRIDKGEWPHSSPFQFIEDMFFEKVTNAIAFANRTGGKTTNISILAHLFMAFKPGCEVMTAGSVAVQATRGYKYFRDFHIENEFLEDLLKEPPIKSRSIYKNTSSLEIIIASIAGFNGPHPQKALLDEVELMTQEVLDQGMSMTKGGYDSTGKMIKGQNIFSSTRKYGTGVFQRLLNKAKKLKDWNVYNWCIWEDLEKCTRKCKSDPIYGDCQAHHKCKGKAHKCKGFYFIEDFITKVGAISDDVWEAEWLNRKPSRSIYVYGGIWNEDIHMIKREEINPETKEKSYVLKDRELKAIGGIDFGTGPDHPFVFKSYLVDITDWKRALQEAEEGEEIIVKPVFYCIYEYRTVVDTMENHAEKIKDSPGWTPEMPIFADPSAKQERIELEAYGVDTYQAINAVESGIKKVMEYLTIRHRKAHFYHFEDYLDCGDIDLVGSDGEYGLYKWSKTKDGQPNKKVPLKMHDHGLDVDRYVIQSGVEYLREEIESFWEEIEQDGYWS